MLGNLMRLLTYSLIAFLLLSTVGLGKLFDYFYHDYSQSNNKKYQASVSAIQQFGQELASTINRSETPQKLVQQWQGKEFSLSINGMSNMPLPKKMIDALKSGHPLVLEAESGVLFHYYLPNLDKLLVIENNQIKMPENVTSSGYIFTMLFYLALVLLILIWLTPLIRRLIKLREAAQRFGRGELTSRIKLSQFSYIKDIELEFNHMAGRVSDLIDDVKLLSSAVSHDLRTPLAKIRLGVDTLQEEEDPKTQRRYIDKISNNVDEMSELVATLLNYARLDNAMLNISSDKVVLARLVEHCIDKFGEADISFRLKSEAVGLLKIQGDKRYLTMAINNLLQNAIAYGNGKVLVTIKESANQLLVEIEDDGEGIAQEQRSNIIKPFIRGSHSKKQPGFGFGLAIVNRVINWHHGQLSISESAQLSGAKFIISLPKID